MTQFEIFVKALNKKKVPCRVKIVNDRFTVECGWNFPNSIFRTVSSIAKECGIENISICAESSVSSTVSEFIYGGPNHYQKEKRR